MTTTQPTWTEADLSAAAEMIRPFLPSGMTPATAVGVAMHEAMADSERRMRRFFYGDAAYRRALVGALAGTYDEFRAEAVA